MENNRIRFISLFAGIGGFDLGLERAGMECVAQVEIDPFCQQVLAKHWPNVMRLSDVRECGRNNLPAADLICGGFPCQPHSVAGKRRGAEDDRDLWPDYRRIIGECRPRWVIGENVPGIRTTILDQVLSDLEGMDYACRTLVIPACAFDAPHKRERVFVLANSVKLGWGGGSNGDEAGRIWALQAKGSCSADKFSDVANPASERLQERDGDGNEPRQTCAPAEFCDWWAVEPPVGRVAARLPVGLDRDNGGLDYAHENCITKARTAGLPITSNVSEVWENRKNTETSPRLSECAICGVPMSEMPHYRGSRKWYLGTWQQESKGVCSVRRGVYELYTYESENMQSGMSISSWQDECKQTMDNRVDRLRALGNAVVPQVVEWIGRMIVEVDATCTE